MIDKVLKFLGSKWFMLILGILMVVILPITYGNLMVVYRAEQISQFWYIPTIFVINILTVIMAFFKFTALISKKKETTSEEWED